MPLILAKTRAESAGMDLALEGRRPRWERARYFHERLLGILRAFLGAGQRANDLLSDVTGGLPGSPAQLDRFLPESVKGLPSGLRRVERAEHPTHRSAHEKSREG